MSNNGVKTINKTVKANIRRKNALQRLEQQLASILPIKLPLTVHDKERITKEIAILKTRV